jgi:acetyl-CoA carboxylase carboxyl transferase subunit beta
MPPRERLAWLLDDGVYEMHYEDILPEDPLGFEDRVKYVDRLASASASTGVSEALMVASGTLGGKAVMVAVFAFEFIGGSMGEVVGERFVRASEQCVANRTPLIVYITSGGARMQEGPWSLVQMARVTSAIETLSREGILYLTCLCHPTTGGVAASMAMIADWVIAEPGAYIAFTGSRVLGVDSKDQMADPEKLFAHGQIDAIVARCDQKSYLSARVALLA